MRFILIDNNFGRFLFFVAAESDLATFVQIKNHFQTNRLIDTSLFTPSSRSDNLRELYDAAAKTPVGAMAEMDRILGENERRSSDIFLCTPVLGMTRRRMKSNIDVEIETRMVSDLGALGGERTCFFYIYFSCCVYLCVPDFLRQRWSVRRASMMANGSGTSL